MGHEQRGDSGLELDATNLVSQARPDPRVQRGQGLVEQQDLGMDREGSRQRDTLLLAPRKLMRVAIAETAEAHDLEHLRRAAPALVQSDVPHLEPKCDILQCGHMREE